PYTTLFRSHRARRHRQLNVPTARESAHRSLVLHRLAAPLARARKGRDWSHMCGHVPRSVRSSLLCLLSLVSLRIHSCSFTPSHSRSDVSYASSRHRAYSSRLTCVEVPSRGCAVLFLRTRLKRRGLLAGVVLFRRGWPHL